MTRTDWCSLVSPLTAVSSFLSGYHIFDHFKTVTWNEFLFLVYCSYKVCCKLATREKYKIIFKIPLSNPAVLINSLKFFSVPSFPVKTIHPATYINELAH